MGSLLPLFTSHADVLLMQYKWAWPICEILHFVGMALLFGTIGLLDLRMLGVAKMLPVGPLEKLVPWGIAGFAINVITGWMFVAGGPEGPLAYLENPAFVMKMIFIALAGVNALAFYVVGVSRTADALGPGDEAPMSAKVIAFTSLFLWIFVIYFGRMIMYSDAFYTKEYYGFGLGF